MKCSQQPGGIFDDRLFMKAIKNVVGVIVLLSGSVWAGDIAPMVELGPSFHTGSPGRSLSGAMGYLFSCRAETRSGWLRPQVAAEFGYSRGVASLGDARPEFNLAGVGFLTGLHFFLIPQGNLQPFIGGSATLGGHLMKMSSPPVFSEPTTQGISLGYEINVGTDIHFGSASSSGSSALRIRGGYFAARTSLAGVTGLELNGYRLVLGWLF